jgi:uroporphyrinogen-III synthase
MRVIVTRPRRQGDRTTLLLAERGHEALQLPLTRPVHDGTAARHALAKSDGAIALTSAEAIHALGDRSLWDLVDLSRPLFTVGKATAAEASEAGFETVLCSDGDGARLADLIVSRRHLLQDKPLTYLAGFPRSEGFETRLQELGVAYRTVDCYRMDDVQPLEPDLQRLLADEPAAAMLFYSRHTAERFFSLPFVLEHLHLLANTRILCFSNTIAGAVPDVLRSNVAVPAEQDEESLLALLDPS